MAFSEKTGLTASSLIDSVSAGVSFYDVNAGDVPTVKVAFGSYVYLNSQDQNVTAGLTDDQRAAIDAVRVPLVVAQDPAGKNIGTATWTYSIDDSKLDFLAEGEELVLTYVAEVNNNYPLNNETTFREFTITVTGTNDTPTIVANQTIASDGVVEDQAVNGAGNIVADGVVTFNDVDLTDTHTVSFVLKSSDASADLPGFAEGVGPGAANIGTFALAPVSEVPADGNTNGSVGWTFTLDDDDPVLQSLAAGQTITQIYTITVSDGHGGTITQDVTVTITGTNDGPNHAPVIVGELTTATGEVVEDTDINLSNEIAADGTITFQDIDLIDTHSAIFVPASSTSNAPLPGFVDNTTYIGTFALNEVSEDNTDTNNIGSVDWTFTLDDSDPVLQSLAEGETITQVYTVTVSDGHTGGTVTQDVTVTITGTNDGPTIESALTTATGGVTEDVAVTSNEIAADGTIIFQDIDLIDTHSAIFVPASSTSNAPLPGFVDNTTYIGTFALNEVSEDNTDTNNIGSVDWSFTLDDSDPVLQSLAEGETITQVYTVTVSDGHTGGTVTQDVTVTITGTNDGPTIESALTTATGGVTEDVAVTSNEIATDGTITFQDIDLIDTHSAIFVPASSTSNAPLPGFVDNTTYIGTFALNEVSEDTDTNNIGSLGWTFTLDNNDRVLQSLAEGETITQV